ncbi:MAG: SRPBCC domain-containing protein [Eudoraea sp.]|nr:SRPBCC domain-containing protein [Eudoraea sp.]
MESLGFDAFTKKIYINAPIESLYRCWSTADGICSWFLSNANYTTKKGEERTANSFIEKGDTYIWKWYNWDGEEIGQILEANGKDMIQFSFAGHCKVTVTLQDGKNNVLLTLVQSNIPTDEKNKLNVHVGCSNGWTFWLANLKAFLEHGILLNERTMDLREIPLASFQFVNI